MLREITEGLDYETWKQQYDEVNNTVDELEKVLHGVIGKSQGSMGLLSDEMRSSSKYRKAQSAFQQAYRNMQAFNKSSDKKFMKQHAKEMRNARRGL